MYPQRQEVTLYDNVTPVAVTSSTDATPVVVTATAHGFKTGQRIFISGHSTNIVANGISVAIVLTANTFSIQDEITGANVVGSGAGSGSGGYALLAPPVIRSVDYRNIVVQLDTAGTTTATFKGLGSQGKTGSFATPPRGGYPNMGATLGPANPYFFTNLINLDSAASLAGSTGIALVATDVNNEYEVNTNAIQYFTFIPTSWTQGSFSAKALLTTNA